MTTAEAPVVSERFEVDLDDVESTLRKLLRSYRIALQFAADMPLLGRSVVEGRTLRRWGSRPFTRAFRWVPIGACERLQETLSGLW